jgi:hypothetical protein
MKVTLHQQLYLLSLMKASLQAYVKLEGVLPAGPEPASLRTDKFRRCALPLCDCPSFVKVRLSLKTTSLSTD